MTVSLYYTAHGMYCVVVTVVIADTHWFWYQLLQLENWGPFVPVCTITLGNLTPLYPFVSDTALNIILRFVEYRRQYWTDAGISFDKFIKPIVVFYPSLHTQKHMPLTQHICFAWKLLSRLYFQTLYSLYDPQPFMCCCIGHFFTQHGTETRQELVRPKL